VNLACLEDNGGCGGTIYVTVRLLEGFRQAALGGGMSCPIRECKRVFTADEARHVVEVFERRAVIQPGDVQPTSAQALGGLGLLTPSDMAQLTAGTLRVAMLMSDGLWHSAEEIRYAAGQHDVPASEGLRRLRELRDIPGVAIQVRRPGASRHFRYRVLIRRPVTAQPQPEERAF
jgi:hypothetical protein